MVLPLKNEHATLDGNFHPLCIQCIVQIRVGCDQAERRGGPKGPEDVSGDRGLFNEGQSAAGGTHEDDTEKNIYINTVAGVNESSAIIYRLHINLYPGSQWVLAAVYLHAQRAPAVYVYKTPIYTCTP